MRPPHFRQPLEDEPPVGIRRRLGAGRERRIVAVDEDIDADHLDGALGHAGEAGFARGGDLALKRTGRQRLQDAAGRLDRLETRPCLFRQGIGQGLHGARPGGRVGETIELGFLGDDELRIARQPSRRCAWRPVERIEGEDRDRVGAADRRGKGRPGRAQHVHAWLAPAHRPPGGLGMDGKDVVDVGGFQRAREQQPHGAQLGDGEELVGVGGQRHADSRHRSVRRKAARIKQAQIFDHTGQYGSQLLRLRGPGRVPDAAIGERQRAGEGLGQPGQLRHRRFRVGEPPRRHRRYGIEGEPEGEPALGRDRRERRGDVRRAWPRVDRQSRTVGQHLRQPGSNAGCRRRQHSALQRMKALRENKRDAVGAASQRLADESERFSRLRCTDARENPPRLTGRPPGNRHRSGNAPVDRADGNAVVAEGGKVAIGSLAETRNGRAPVSLGDGGKAAGQRHASLHERIRRTTPPP